MLYHALVIEGRDDCWVRIGYEIRLQVMRPDDEIINTTPMWKKTLSP